MSALYSPPFILQTTRTAVIHSLSFTLKPFELRRMEILFLFAPSAECNLNYRPVILLEPQIIVEKGSLLLWTLPPRARKTEGVPTENYKKKGWKGRAIKYYQRDINEGWLRVRNVFSYAVINVKCKNSPSPP